MFIEPVNGNDRIGERWIRKIAKSRAERVKISVLGRNESENLLGDEFER